MKQSLQLKLHQQLSLTPQLQQSIRLLQLSTLELDQEIGQMLQDNPMLERLDEGYAAESGQTAEPSQETPAGVSGDDIYDEMAWGERSYGSASSEDDEDRQFQQSDTASLGLRQHLLDQLSLTAMPERDRRLVALLIESLDEEGYLAIGLDELMDMLPAELDFDRRELEAALKLLQSFDPIGVGARNLSECLLLQLNALPAETPFLEAAKSVVRDHLDLLAEREYGKLKKILDIPNDRDFIAVRQLITSLDPRPGALYAPVDARYVVPDVMVKKVKGM